MRPKSPLASSAHQPPEISRPLVSRLSFLRFFAAITFAYLFFGCSIPSTYACDDRATKLNDRSCERYVWPDFPLSFTGFVPDGLEPIPSDPFLVTKGDILAEPQALTALQAMSLDFFDVLQFPILVVSGYRGYAYQLELSHRAKSCIRDGFCALPGRSEHQTGLAFDLFEFSDQETFFRSEQNASAYRWLNANAHRYGFVQTYSKWREIDGYHVEPWHWRYVGVSLAAELHWYARSPAQNWSTRPLRYSLLDDFIPNSNRYGPFARR